MHAKSLQLCPTLCDPMDYSLQGSAVHGFSRQENQSWLPCPPPGDLPDPGIEPASLKSPALAGRFCTAEPQLCDTISRVLNYFASVQ